MADSPEVKLLSSLLAELCEIVLQHEQILREVQADASGLKTVSKDPAFPKERDAAFHDLGKSVGSERRLREA
jgi:hypothetical protein